MREKKLAFEKKFYGGYKERGVKKQGKAGAGRI
jgi:hypothetical protein